MYSEVQKYNYDALVQEHAILVKRIAYHLLGRLPDSIQVEDLIQSGMIGLLEAARNYDGSKGASFETYAGIRIRGSMLDEVRRGDWAPRSVHRNSRRVSEVIKQIENETGKSAEDVEVAKRLDISLDEYHGLLQDTASCKLFSFEELVENNENADDFVSADPMPNPLVGVEKLSFQRYLVEAIKTLPEREQLILSLYYDEELNLKEIGAVLGVSESRVSQLHSQATHRLRAKLSNWV